MYIYICVYINICTKTFMLLCIHVYIANPCVHVTCRRVSFVCMFEYTIMSHLLDNAFIASLRPTSTSENTGGAPCLQTWTDKETETKRETDTETGTGTQTETGTETDTELVTGTETETGVERETDRAKRRERERERERERRRTYRPHVQAWLSWSERGTVNP